VRFGFVWEHVCRALRSAAVVLEESERFDAIHAVVARIVVHSNGRVDIDAAVPLADDPVTPTYVRNVAAASMASWSRARNGPPPRETSVTSAPHAWWCETVWQRHRRTVVEAHPLLVALELARGTACIMLT